MNKKFFINFFIALLAAMVFITCILEENILEERINSTGNLSAPGGVYARANSSTSITVSWSSVSNAAGYRVYRRTGQTGYFSELYYSYSTSYTDTGLSASTTYYYYVTAYNNYRESSQSSTVSATTLTDNRPFNYSDGAANIGRAGPGGGRVFYYNPSGFTVEGYTGAQGSFSTYTAYYLEAAPSNSSSAVWGDYGTLVSGITTFTSTNDSNANKIGNGRKDTQTIAAHMRSKSITGTAAQVCISASFGGVNDWFLPSLGELYLYYQSSVPDKPTWGFWSSSQYSSSYAWGINFIDGSRYYNFKNYNYYVRAVRAF